jgi:hypothetical protein
MGILRELELVGTIPVNIERIIRGQGIKLNTNAKPEDFTKNNMKKEIIEIYKDSLGRKIIATFLQSNVRLKIEDKKIEEIITKKSFESKRKQWEQIG